MPYTLLIVSEPIRETAAIRSAIKDKKYSDVEGAMKNLFKKAGIYL